MVGKKRVPKMVGFMAYVRKPTVAKLDKLIKERGLESRAQVVRNLVTAWVDTEWAERESETANAAG